MELWIRSQDKEILLKVNELEIEENMIIAFDNNKYQCLGTYKTKERALQVLNEIHNILQPRIIIHEPEINYGDIIQSLSENIVIKTNQKTDIELKQAGQVVYQMPEE